jgi:hypothetical protein
MSSIAHAQTAVPPPSDTPAVVIVSGHTSTAVSIKTVKVGSLVPRTYAGQMIHHYPGFVFYVSQHYALQSDMGDAYCTSLLEVAELAYPHWVDLVGAEPPDPDTRMYFVYASTADLMKKVMSSDIGLSPPDEYGGGITMYANHSAYNYPSGSLQYHQRALMIHENLHMLQMVGFGTGGLEDFTYSAEQSVYDPAKKQLTVMVFDKATTNNWTDVGLSRYQKERPSFAEFLPTAWSVGGAPAVMLTQFMWTDPDRFLKWRIWRDEYYLGHIDSNTVGPVTASIFGSLGDVDKAWQAWLSTRHNSFHYVDWGWEQNGNALWSPGFPQHSAFSETDLLYKPGERATYDPYRMDYPTEPISYLVGPIKRGVDTPSVGATVDFSRNHENGIAGMALGVTDSTYYAVMIDGEATLSVFSQGIADTGLDLPRRDFPLPAAIIDAGKANGHLYGVTMQIKPSSLEVTVRSGSADNVQSAVFDVPINSQQRERMIDQYMAVIAKSNSHGITAYIDDARKPSPDLYKAAPPNFWRFDGMDRLETLYKASWRLGRSAPNSLRTLKAEMLQAVEGDPKTQARAASDYEAHVLGVFHDVQKCNVDDQTKALALTDLAGVFVVDKVTTGGAEAYPVSVKSTTINRLEEPAECTVTFPECTTSEPAPVTTTLTQYRPHVETATYPSGVSEATVNYAVTWRGEHIALTLTLPISGH